MRLVPLVSTGLLLALAVPATGAPRKVRKRGVSPAVLAAERQRRQDLMAREYVMQEAKLRSADDLLSQLDLDGAIHGYREILEAPEGGTGIGGDLNKAFSLQGLARASAEKAEFREAVEQINGYVTRYPTGCGNCYEARQAIAHLLRTVWKTAMFPPAEAEAKLRRISAGEFAPSPSYLKPRQRGRAEAGCARGQPRAR